jgi:nucleotide-binding universal stress UspA family protein
MTAMAIVVGIDGSPAAIDALRWAVREAAARDLPVRAVAVYDYLIADVIGASVQLHPFTGDPARAFEHAVAAADTVRAETPDAHIEPEAVEGDPGHVLCELAKGAALVVVGRHGTRLRPHRLGSVASHVVHHAPCPVVVVPAPES